MQKQKIAIITGGASGMGLQAAIKLHQESNYHVIVADRSFVKSQPPVFLEPIICDVDYEQDIKRLFRLCRESYGRLDLLINFAGIHMPTKIRDVSAIECDAVYKTNMRGTVLCCREALQLMSAGVIINIASDVAIAADKDAPLYAASKAFVLHLTKCLALEYGRTIRCNAICPGPIDTQFLRDCFHNDEQVMRDYAEMNPRGRFARPDEVADLIVFLASEKADFINGATLSIDGGGSIVYGGEPPKK